MTRTVIAVAAAALLFAGYASPAPAQSAPSATQAPATEDAKPSKRSRNGATKREMSVKGMAASERRKKCGVEWKEAKAAGTTNGMKWPKFYSQCNARLKGNNA
jgi:hypothetical protein